MTASSGKSCCMRVVDHEGRIGATPFVDQRFVRERVPEVCVAEDLLTLTSEQL